MIAFSTPATILTAQPPIQFQGKEQHVTLESLQSRWVFDFACSRRLLALVVDLHFLHTRVHQNTSLVLHEAKPTHTIGEVMTPISQHLGNASLIEDWRREVEKKARDGFMSQYSHNHTVTRKPAGRYICLRLKFSINFILIKLCIFKLLVDNTSFFIIIFLFYPVS